MNTRPLVAFATLVYNGEKTLARTMECVLNQTYDHFIYYVFDNGSTDTTAEIIKKYVAQDTRVRLVSREVNITGLPAFVWMHDSIDVDYDYYTCIDSDDTCVSTYLEKMLSFSISYNLDIVCCGFTEVDAASGWRNNLVMEKAVVATDIHSLEQAFPLYRLYAAYVWGSLYRASVFSPFKNADFSHLNPDESFNLLPLIWEQADTVGLLPESLFAYYVHSKSDSFQLSYHRLHHGRILYDAWSQYLIKKFGAVSLKNDESLLGYYTFSIHRSTNVVLDSSESLSKKIECLLEIYTRHVTQRYMAWPTHKQKKIKLVESVLSWTMKQNSDTKDEYNKLVDVLTNTLASLNSHVNTAYPQDFSPLCKNSCDDEFYTMLNSLNLKTTTQLIEKAIAGAKAWLTEDYVYYGQMLQQYNAQKAINHFSMEKGFVDYFSALYKCLKDNVDQLGYLYGDLEDNRSKYTLKILLSHWLTFHPCLKHNGMETIFARYFDLDIIHCNENEVFVDCGSHTGDTVQEYISQFGNRYKSIYAYESAADVYAATEKQLKGTARLHLRNAMVSNVKKTNNAISYVRIDDDISEDVTFIKMDIGDGMATMALLGAARQIRNNKPKLAICLHHNITDLFEIPRLVKQLVPTYKLYLRHSPTLSHPIPDKYILFAVHSDMSN